MWLSLTFLAVLVLLPQPPAAAAIPSPAGESVGVVIGTQAPELERFAADELCAYLDKLFGIRVRPSTSMPAAARNIFLIGSPETNPLIQTQWFPRVTDQGIVLKPAKAGKHSALVVGGGSPAATMWAVYDLVERWGVRYLLHADALPPKREFTLPAFDLVQEPILRVRQWRVVNEHAMGPVSWGMADYRPVLSQLAKLKFNRLLIYLWPEQPFLPFEYKGLRHAGGTLFFGDRLPITPDMAGRELFGQEKVFWNPDLPAPGGDADQLNRAAVSHVRQLIDFGHQRGMKCVLPVTLTEFPAVFKPLIQHTRQGHMNRDLTFGLGADEDVDDPELAGLARAVLAATLKTYPDLDYLELGVAEQREWAREYERAWKALDAKHGIHEALSLESALAAARARKDYPGGAERAVSEVKADILALYFFDKIISDPQIKQLVGSRKFVVGVAEELFPALSRIFPSGCETLNFVDYTPSRIVKRREVLKAVPAREVPSVLIYTLHDDNVGPLPQLATHSLHELTRDIRELGWAGFSTRYWLTGDHDACITYLSRAAWDRTATPEDVCRDQVAHVCGEAAVPDMLTLFRELEAATVTLEWEGLGFAFPTDRMLLQHWSPRPLSAGLKSVIPAYQRALEAARRAEDKSQATGKNYVHYWIGRLEFGIAYMQAIEAVRAAAAANAAKDTAGAIREAERAMSLLRRGLTQYAAVTRDRSDKGAIASMNEYVVRPLQRKIDGLRTNVVAAAPSPAVRAVEFQSRKVYQSKQHPSYTSWVSFFPGEHGQWYLTCEEVTRPETPLPGVSWQQFYEMGLPRGYDKSKQLMEVVMLESEDGLQTWREIAREPVRFQHSAGSFGQARTRDGRFLRFLWSCYSLNSNTAPNEIFYESADNGQSWKKMPAFHDRHFVSWPHRLRTLRDGTLVLCVPMRPRWGKGSDYPTRTALRLDVNADMQMSLFISRDQGHSWSGPLPILPGQNVSETDFVELPDGNLLFVNNSIFANPGRQLVYRSGDTFTPGPLEHVHSGRVPETVCLANDGVLVGCMRAGSYFWSDDLGQNWQPLDGAKGNGEVYQPWIQYLGDGKVACAGHYGLDDPVGKRDQYICLQTFKVDVVRKTAAAKLWIERDYDEATSNFLNSFVITLTANGAPLPDKDVQIWHVFRDAPGYDSRNSLPLAERMKLGGKSITVRTGADGKGRFALPEYDGISDIHSSYQMVVRFNREGQYPDYKPTQLPQLEFYANNGL